MEQTENLQLPYLIAAQAQKHVTHNEALRALDAIVHLSISDRDLTAPPALPLTGERYLLAAGSTGAWAGHDGEIAAFQDGAWMFYTPRAGWVAWIADEATAAVFDGSAWVGLGGGGGGAVSVNPTPLVGVNATADALNRLSVAADAALFSHDGSDHRLKINKAAAADVASLVYQSGFSGRAEIGLTGDDDFHFKVSPDGSTFHEAILIDKDTGEVSFPNTTLGGGGGGGGGGGAPDILLVEEYANPTNVSGPAATWNTRNLNTEKRDANGEAALAAGGVALSAGTWMAMAWGVVHRTNRHKLRLYQTTGATGTLVVGSGMNAQDSNNTTNKSHLVGVFTLAAAETVELQHYVGEIGAGPNNMGVASLGNGDNEAEVYSMLALWRVA